MQAGGQYHCQKGGVQLMFSMEEGEREYEQRWEIFFTSHTLHPSRPISLSLSLPATTDAAFAGIFSSDIKEERKKAKRTKNKEDARRDLDPAFAADVVVGAKPPIGDPPQHSPPTGK